MKLAMIIDKRRCYGCNGCAIACKQTNATQPGTYYTRVQIRERGTFPNAVQEYVPEICNHCDDAPCVRACPSGASMKMEDGTVQIDAKRCIGCEACIPGCPYNNRFLNSEKKATYWGKEGQDVYEQARSKEHLQGTVAKCSFCAPRREKGMTPACVETCPGGARIFGDLDDPNSEISKVFKKYNPQPMESEFGAKPRVFYIDI